MIKLLALVLMLFGVFLFGLGYHNVDLSVNFLNQGIGNDYNAIGALYPMEEIYLSGMKELLISVVMMISGFLFLFKSDKKCI
jgi:hypothetical protein